jgi:hypothetical protein
VLGVLGVLWRCKRRSVCTLTVVFGETLTEPCLSPADHSGEQFAAVAEEAESFAERCLARRSCCLR